MLGVPDIRDVRNVRSRSTASGQLFAEVTIAVSGETPVDEAHRLADAVEAAIEREFGTSRGDGARRAGLSAGVRQVARRRRCSTCANVTMTAYLVRASSTAAVGAWAPSHRPTRSLKHEYELFVEQEIENYKESVPRSVLLGIGDEAVSSLVGRAAVRADRARCSAKKSIG